MTRCRLSCVCKKRVIQCRPIKKWRRYISRQYVGLRIALNISLKPRKEVSSTLLIVHGNIPSRFPPLSSRRRRVRPSMRSRSWRSSPRCSRNPRGRSPCTRARTCRSSASRSPRTWGTPRAAPAPTRRRRRGACPCTNRIRNGDIFRRRRGIRRPRWRTRRSDPRRTPNREFSLRDHSGGGGGGRCRVCKLPIMLGHTHTTAVGRRKKWAQIQGKKFMCSRYRPTGASHLLPATSPPLSPDRDRYSRSVHPYRYHPNFVLDDGHRSSQNNIGMSKQCCAIRVCVAQQQRKYIHL